jgi:hypothetical protein
MVTEPLFASVANAIGNLENVGKVPKELKGMVSFDNELFMFVNWNSILLKIMCIVE